jgi:hypothetical protein
MTSLPRLGLSFLTVLGVAVSCLADFTIDAPVTLASAPPGAIPTTRAITIGKFDPALGTLTSVQITMRTVLQGAMGVENQSGLSGSTNVSLTFNAGVFLFPSAMMPPTLAAVPASGTPAGTYRTDLPAGTGAIGGTIAQVSTIPTLAAFDGALDYSGMSGATFSIGPVGTGIVANFASTLVAPSDLAGFVGPAGAPRTLSYTFSSSGATNGAGTGGNMTFFYNGLAATDIRVQYSFVPEPASWVLLVSGLVAPVALRWYRRRGARRLNEGA